MKIKDFIYITLFLLCTSSICAEKFLIDNYVVYKNNLWQKTVYKYNSDKNIISTTVFTSTNQVEWTNDTYSTRVYYNGAISEICNYKWDNNSWKINKRQTFEYLQDKLTLHTITYDNMQEVISYKYNDNTTIQEQRFLQNNTLINCIVSIQKEHNNRIDYIKTYSLSNKQDTLFSQETIFEYTPHKTTSTTYDKTKDTYIPTTQTITTLTNNNITSEVQYKYKQNHWEPFAKQTYYYNSSNQVIEILYQIWNSNFWLSDYKRLYAYNNDGDLLSSTIEILQYKEWEMLYQINYNYNNQLNNAFIEQSFWSETDKEYNDYISLQGNNAYPFVHGNNVQITYTDTPTNTLINTSPISIYPNPSKSGIVFIQTNQIIHKIAVYNLNGALVYQSQYPGSINLSHLDNGMYIIQITTNEGYFSFKQIIAND